MDALASNTNANKQALGFILGTHGIPDIVNRPL